MLVGSAATAAGYVASVVLFVTGIALGLWALSRRPPKPIGSSPRAVLDERLARGLISLEDYARRRSVLAGRSGISDGGRGPRAAVLVAVAFTVVGLAGSAVIAATETRGGFAPMMGGWMMGGGGVRNGRAAEPVPGARQVVVVGDEYSFRPKVIGARPRELVNVEFVNRGDQYHTLTVESLGFDLRASGGETVTGSLRAPASGTFSIVCAVPGHAEAGMRARLVVRTAS